MEKEDADSFMKSALMVCIALIIAGVLMKGLLAVLFICVGVYLLPTVWADWKSK